MSITILPLWRNQTVVCIASGPSLTQDQVDQVKGLNTIAINDAYKLAPWANILYACDYQWWDWHKGVPDFKGYKLQHAIGGENKGHSPIIKPYPGIDIILESFTFMNLFLIK